MLHGIGTNGHRHRHVAECRRSFEIPVHRSMTNLRSTTSLLRKIILDQFGVDRSDVLIFFSDCQLPGSLVIV